MVKPVTCQYLQDLDKQINGVVWKAIGLLIIALDLNINFFFVCIVSLLMYELFL